VSILPIDTGRYGTKEMLDIFREQKKIDYQLDIEAAAALSQSEIGLISASIARDIAKVSKSGKITARESNSWRLKVITTLLRWWKHWRKNVTKNQDHGFITVLQAMT